MPLDLIVSAMTKGKPQKKGVSITSAEDAVRLNRKFKRQLGISG